MGMVNLAVSRPRVCAIVPAAGAARRMGTQKLLLPAGNQPMIARVVNQLRGCGLTALIVVIGRSGGAIAEALLRHLAAELRAITTIRTNPDPAGDMLSSVREGLRGAPVDCDGVLLLPADLAAISAEVAQELVRGFAAARDRIFVPTHGGRRGHPMVFPAAYREEILTHYDATGLRGLLAAHPEAVTELEVASPAVLLDVDAPADYERALALLGLAPPASA